MRKVTNEELSDVYYRSLLLSERTEELEGIINGTETSLLPMITDENGKSAAEKVDALAAELVESFRHYRELNNRELADWEEEMYSCFLYCAMQMYREKHNTYDWYMTYKDIPDTFGAIIDAAKSVDADKNEFKSFRDFFAEVYTSNRVRILDTRRRFRMSDFCERGKKALNDLGFDWWYDNLMIFDPPRDLHIELCERFAREHEDDEANERYRRLAEDSEKLIGELKEARKKYIEGGPSGWTQEDFYQWLELQYEPIYLDEDENRDNKIAKLKELRGESRMEYYECEELKECSPEEIWELWSSIDSEDQRKRHEKWREFVADKDILQKRFARFIQLYYDHDCSNFCYNVRNMVMSYLIEHDLCSMAFGDYYGLVTRKLRTAMKMVSNEIERVRNEI